MYYAVSKKSPYICMASPQHCDKPVPLWLDVNEYYNDKR